MSACQLDFYKTSFPFQRRCDVTMTGKVGSRWKHLEPGPLLLEHCCRVTRETETLVNREKQLQKKKIKPKRVKPFQILENPPGPVGSKQGDSK